MEDDMKNGGQCVGKLIGEKRDQMGAHASHHKDEGGKVQQMSVEDQEIQRLNPTVNSLVPARIT